LSVIEEQEASRDIVRERSWSIFMDPRYGAVLALSEWSGFMRMLPSAWARKLFFL